MNKKGFTLVELLAVIIILALLVVLASTSVTKLVGDSKNDLYNSQIELIKSAAQIWGADNLDKLPEVGKCSYLTLENLKGYGLIDPEINNPKTNQKFSDDMNIKISAELTEYNTIIYIYKVNSDDITSCTKIYS